MTQNRTDPPDQTLISNSLQGDRNSLGQLVTRHRDLVYNICLKMCWHREDAADSTQEVLIKMITHLHSFRQDSSFTTWLYRITVNHILNEKKEALGKRKLSFQQFGTTLDTTPDTDPIAAVEYQADLPLLIEETKQTCMSGMLMCLDDRHRMVFLLGELFGIKDTEGSQIMDITKENFRMMLSRARKDLYSFMEDKCGLINKANPCRCAKKTISFIKAGFVDPRNRLFTGEYRSTIEEAAGAKQDTLENELYIQHRSLFQKHNYLQSPDFLQSLRDWLDSDQIKQVFNFN